MSDSQRTDTRSFYSASRIVLAIMVMALASPPLANAKTQTSQEIRASEALSNGLFANLPPLDVAPLLGSLASGEIVITSGIDKNILSSAAFDLLQYVRNNVDSKTPDEILSEVPKYKRAEMFGTWVNENAPQDCYNTRAEVLIRDAKPGSKIQFAPANPCLVSKGEWHDPYSSVEYKLASAVQIDHVVPLKNAYRSGAHAWTHERRCTYANFLEDDHHLLAVSGHENMAKGDSGPEGYLPPEPAYVCEYVTNWMRIKAVWNLTFSADEKTAIETTLRDHNCSVPATNIELQTFQKFRTLTTHMNIKCADAQTAE